MRVLFVYVFLVIALRVLGKREFGELAPFDLVVLMLIPEFFQQAVAGEDFSMTNAVVASSTLLTIVLLTSILAYRSQKVSELVAGSPTVLASAGRLVTEQLHRSRVTPDEIYSAIHMSGLEDLSQTRFVILDNDGKIAVVPRLPAHVRRTDT
jgi:uncharacterized membrane protein YcaP (DUF421 family)